MADIDILLRAAQKMGASDLHLKSGLKPRFRVGGSLEEPKDFLVLTTEDIDRLTSEILTDDQKEHFAQNHELDFTHGNDASRFRCAYYQDHCGIGAVFRRIPAEVPTLAELNLPEDLAAFAHLRRGLMLVTGATGSGKTSTLASILSIINETYPKHIITLEDPIEYLHEDKRAVIHQRRMYEDFDNFESGISDAMRQDPDVMMIGELRDLESIRQALTAAETGVLVFGTLHTNGAADSIDRIIDAFPAQEQSQVRVQLSESLAGIISQVLLNRCDGPGRVPATEVLVATNAVSSIIRDGKTQDIINVIQSGKSVGMRTMDDSLQDLLRRKCIDVSEAALYARNKKRFALASAPG